jgi:3-isopropylmalate/(R)-2-methylmalate dehydratase small subunit
MPTPIKRFQGVALPLLRDNVDTDELSPSWALGQGVSQGYGVALFCKKRYMDGPGFTPNGAFILNQAPYDRSGILVAGSNFGCGSSRETAVWALRDFGFRVVIAVSFNDTFKRNCIVNGFAPLEVERGIAERLVESILHKPDAGITADLEANSVWIGQDDTDRTLDQGPFPVSIDPFYRQLLISGNSEDDMLKEIQPQIEAHRAAFRLTAPWLGS